MSARIRWIGTILPFVIACAVGLGSPAEARSQEFAPSVTLSEAGWSEAVGTWDPVTRRAVLTRQVTCTIEIEADGVVLDGGGFDVWGTSAVGVYARGRSDVTIADLPVGPFQTGILLEDCVRCTVLRGSSVALVTGVRIDGGTDDTVRDRRFEWPGHAEVVAVEASGSPAVTIDGNTAAWSSYKLYSCTDATVSGNTVTECESGIYLEATNGSRVTGNAASGCERGIDLVGSDNNQVDHNVLSDNRLAGLLLSASDRNTCTDNTISASELTGVWIEDGYDNRFYHNDMLGNWAWQAYVVGGGGNLFSLPRPVGGNHWSDRIAPDADGDGFVDLPYQFAGGTDELPFVAPHGWSAPDTTPPETTAAVDPVVANGANGWYTRPPRVSLNAGDGGSGVAATYFRWDEGTDAAYTGPLTAPEGIHTLRFHSVDEAGNAEPEQSLTLKLDSVPPPPPVITLPAAGSSVDNPVTLSGTSEPGSQVIAFEGESLLATVQADSTGVWASPPLELAEGEHTVVVAAADEAGNILIPTSLVTFVRTPTTLVFASDSASSAPLGGVVHLSARLSDAHGTPASGRSVRFSFGSRTVTATTDDAGAAAADVALTEAEGVLSVTAEFDGDGAYGPSSAPVAEIAVYDPFSHRRISGSAAVACGTSTARVKVAAWYPYGASIPSGSFSYTPGSGPSVTSSGLSYLVFAGDSTLLAGGCTVDGAGGYTFTADASTTTLGEETLALTVRDTDGTVVFANAGALLRGSLRIR